ncbi:NAD(P)/FAD-dependent oxidoreductase [Rhodococcus sp. IEGM 1409]|uniref:flavin-containing monooxygenase n=1 Tax=Rhodococcus sp. IEGM 1409 TaxID=3047082 RepID=UPI0024B6AB2A|nr:NAD(P)/FAD-dependent oxidoreductase [Rhodococcus sp. IEGM 1409]MDI9901484.1 NAD(P)/FAD-dependent oxidoreductase [Rhodococcus sp. IEGM 1409]
MHVYTVVVVGSGIGGQCAAKAMLEQGINDLVILERRSFAGGTWRQNRYPGAAVDVQSPLYSIASEPFEWTRMFAEQDELERYTEHVIESNGLAALTHLDTNVTKVEWCGDHWFISTSRGDYLARFVINASGPLSSPVIPAYPGRHRFRGAQFHTNDWDTDYDYRGKRVAIVGSGASAAQVIPAIQPDVAHLHVFQRTPHWVMPRPDRDFTPLQRKLLKVSLIRRAVRSTIYWSLETRIVGFKYSKLGLRLVAERKARGLLKSQVTDDKLRAKITPDYTIGCKRIILSNKLYPALGSPDVSVHDREDGIAEITETGIVTTSGARVDVDLLVWATGYDATDGLISYPVIGRGRRELAETWNPYPRAYLGTTIPQFPNLFIVTGPNTGIGHTSAIFLIEAQMEYIVQAISAVTAAGAVSIEVREDAEKAYTEKIHREMEGTVWKEGGCHSWYQSRSGHVVAMFPGFSFTFRRWARRFRRKDHYIQSAVTRFAVVDGAQS